MLPGSRMHRLKEVFIGEFGQGLAPIMPDCRSVRSDISNQCRQKRRKVIAAPPLKLREQIGRPVRSVILKAVAEDRIGRMVAKRREQPIADCMKMILDRLAVIVVKHKAGG